MSLLPAGFHFSQASLQDFQDCPRRFYLRHVRRLSWPAPQSEPQALAEQARLRGERFHHLAYQFLSGISAEQLNRQVYDPRLAEWRQSFQQFIAGQFTAGTRLFPEISLVAPLGDVYLTAKYDLIAAFPDGALVIFDWKTGAARPNPNFLRSRLQSRVYPYLLRRAGNHINGGQPVSPGSIAMRYWNPNHPDVIIGFPYDESKFQEDEADLLQMTAEIAARTETGFPLTDDERRCSLCIYRSYCERGVQAGTIDLEGDEQAANLFDLELDLGLPSEPSAETLE